MNNKLTTPKAILIGSFMIAVSFLFFPPPTKVKAGTCDEGEIINRILYCLDGAKIRGDVYDGDLNAKLSTYCNS